MEQNWQWLGLRFPLFKVCLMDFIFKNTKNNIFLTKTTCPNIHQKSNFLIQSDIQYLDNWI